MVNVPVSERVKGRCRMRTVGYRQSIPPLALRDLKGRGEEDSLGSASSPRADRLALALQSRKPVNSRYQARSVESVRNVAVVRYYRQD